MSFGVYCRFDPYIRNLVRYVCARCSCCNTLPLYWDCSCPLVYVSTTYCSPSSLFGILPWYMLAGVSTALPPYIGVLPCVLCQQELLQPFLPILFVFSLGYICQQELLKPFLPILVFSFGICQQSYMSAGVSTDLAPYIGSLPWYMSAGVIATSPPRFRFSIEMWKPTYCNLSRTSVYLFCTKFTQHPKNVSSHSLFITTNTNIFWITITGSRPCHGPFSFLGRPHLVL